MTTTSRLILFFSVFVLALAALLSNGRTMSTGDSVPYRYLPKALLREGTFRLDAFPELASPDVYAVVRDREGHLISKKPVSPALLQLPVYVGWRVVAGPLDDDDRLMVGKLTMSIVAALAAAVLALLLARTVPLWLAAAGGLSLVLATPFWFTAMDCWPHPMLAAANVLSLWLLASKRPAAVVCIGALQALAITARLGAAPVALVFAVAVVLCGEGSPAARARRLALFTAGAAGPLLLLAIYNATYFGSPFSQGFGSQSANRIRLPFEGIAGLLFSPAKGLFLFSPVLLAMVLHPIRILRVDVAARVAAVAALLHLVFWACYADWWGGWAWGPRYLADVMPFIVFLAALGVHEALQGRRRIVWSVLLAMLLAASVAQQAIGAFTWNGDYHARFDKGWGEGRFWVWSAPPEAVWRLQHRN